MIKVKGRNYYISEELIDHVYEGIKGHFIAVLKNGEKVEIDECDYINLGGE